MKLEPASRVPIWAVITRPAPDHAVLVEGAEALGLKSLHSPVHVLEASPDQQRILEALDDVDIAIVTSPATARYVIATRPVGTLRHLTWIAPGAGSAAPLRAVGLKVCWPSDDGTSEAVLMLPELAAIEGRKVAILGAPGGRTRIAAELERRGAQVQWMHLYRRRAIAPDPGLFRLLASGARLVVLVSSVQIVERLTAAIPADCLDAWREAVFVVSSARVEQSCRAHGLDHLIRAKGASTGQLLDGLKRALELFGNCAALGTAADEFR